MKKKVNLYKVIMLMIVTVMVTFILTTVFVYNVLQGKVKTNPIIIGAAEEVLISGECF